MEFNLARDLEISKFRLSLSGEQLKAFDKIIEEGSSVHQIPEEKKEMVRFACSFMLVDLLTLWATGELNCSPEYDQVIAAMFHEVEWIFGDEEVNEKFIKHFASPTAMKSHEEGRKNLLERTRKAKKAGESIGSLLKLIVERITKK